MTNSERNTGPVRTADECNSDPTNRPGSPGMGGSLELKKRAAAETLMVYLTWTAIEGRDLKALTELLEVSRDGSR